MRIAPSLIVAACWLSAGCGGPEATPPAEAPTSPSPPAPAPAPAAAPKASTESEPAPEPSPSKTDPAADDADATRTVTYVVAPGGALKVSVSGVKFTVSATAVKVAAG